MGVFLERVQFKFASIIGELCSDPVVMSQFAVWVDLKIAEYKAKGAMSLECLGDKPEPSWMKGVIPPEHSSRELSTDHSITNPRKGIGVTGEVTLNSSRPHSTESHHNLLSSEVVVKPEPNSPSPSPSPAAEAYPVTFHHNTTLHCTPSRKRFSEDDSVTDREIHCNKHQRTSSSSSSHILTDALGTPSHQSLLCVIGEEIWENAQLKDIHTYSSGENLLQVASTSDGDPGWGVQDMSSFNNSSSDNSLSQENTDTSNNKEMCCSCNRAKPDVYTKKKADKFGMVELIPGTHVYLYPDQLQIARKKTVAGTDSTSSIKGDGCKMGRYLLTVFFTTQDLATHSLTSAQTSLYPPLNQRIVEAIKSFSVLNSDTPRPLILRAMRSSLTSKRSKARKTGSVDV